VTAVGVVIIVVVVVVVVVIADAAFIFVGVVVVVAVVALVVVGVFDVADDVVEAAKSSSVRSFRRRQERLFTQLVEQASSVVFSYVLDFVMS